MTAALAIPSPFEAASARLRASSIVLTVRVMGDDDRRFVEDFLCTYSKPHRTPYADWRRYYKPQAAKTMSDCNVLIAATDVDGTDVILGMLIVDRKRVRTVYVKLAYRGCGIGMRLIESAGLSLPIRTVGQPSPSWKKWAAVYGLPWEVA